MSNNTVVYGPGPTELLVDNTAAVLVTEPYPWPIAGPAERICLTGVSIVLTKGMVSPERDLIVRAETVEISESLLLPGRTVHIFAREVKCAAGVYIDVSGKTGTDAGKQGRAKDGATDGQPGSHGANGEGGYRGGNIKIMADQLSGKLQLIAKGGKGGGAQDGGNGATGKRGTDGKTGERNLSWKFNKKYEDNASAGSGHQGGAAGHAGVPGRGGNGGSVSVIIYSGVEAGQVSTDVSGGDPGKKGKAGRPGAGGQPGNVGWYFWHTNPSKPGKPTSTPMGISSYAIKQPGRGAFYGPVGRVAPAPAVNTPGIPGTADIQNPAYLNDDYFGEQLTPMLGRVLLREAFMDHLNGRYQEAVQLLAWISWLLSAETPRAADLAKLIDADAPGEDTVPDHEFEPMRLQTALQIRRLQLGLDAYGNAPSFIPMITYKAYEDYSGRWLDSAQRAEVLYLNYRDKNRAQEEKIKDLEKAVRELDLLVVNLQRNQEDNYKASNSLQDDIAGELLAVHQAGSVLMGAAADFREAVRKHSACDLKDVITAAGAIVSIASGNIGAVKGVADAIEAIDNWGDKPKDDKGKKEPGVLDKLEGITQKFADATGKKGLSGIAEAYGTIKGLLEDSPLPNIPADEAKILVEKEEIEETIKQFKMLPEAKDYQKAIDKYMELVIGRNKKIMEHDALVMHAKELQNAIDQARMDMEQIKTQIADTTDPNLPQFVEFMERTLDVYKTELVRGLYQAHRALAYLTLTDEAFTIQRESVAHLEYTYRILDQRLLRAGEDRGRDHQVLKLGHRMARFQLSELLDAAEMTRLKSRQAVDILIPEDQFQDYYHVYATSVRPMFQGLPTEAQPALRLVHSGNAKFHDKDGLIRTFTHTARTTIAYHAEEEGASLGQSEDFIALSPYGPWRLDLDLRSNQDISFEGLEDITLEFELKYLPRT